MGGSLKAEGLGDGLAGAIWAVIMRLYDLTGTRPAGSLLIQGDNPGDRKNLVLTPPIVPRSSPMPHGLGPNTTSLDTTAQRSSVTVRNQMLASFGGAGTTICEPSTRPGTVRHWRLLIGPVSVV